MMRGAVQSSLGTVALVGALACESYGEYSSLRVADDAARSTPSTGGRAGNDVEAGVGGKRSSGGRHDAAVHDSSSFDAISEAGAPSREGGVDAAREASTPIHDGAVAPDHAPGPSPTDIYDGATLRPTVAVATCGFRDATFHFDGGAAHESRVIDFGCSDVLQDFQFLTPAPSIDGPGNWVFASTGDPHIVQTANVQAFPARGAQAVLEGAHAIYPDLIFRNGKVSVHAWSSDDDAACLVARYQDEVHYYRMCIYTPGQRAWVVGRIDLNQFIELGRGSAADSPSHPGHVMGLEFVGQTIRAFVDDTLRGEYEDPGGFSFGFVGLETIVLQDANFDDLTIVRY